ncbi:TetR family transcriptional regulator [Stappia sp. GBMRC 2046]|uniref:TetR family transcriptional regulator n=1 Tax=Stappia sediminis TaxID=2692190 RepID=A0A7X3LTU0_9HYPH|nr:TetR/AcrR family transcriptional regulator [Stappia sediminis]MXN65000.1 TetR family transcriptional regulator [Stappia sediminis]
MSVSDYSGRAAEILDVAEARMREGGFEAVSFRDIAAAIGIKSASVHYHFPHKTDLGHAVIERYQARFAEQLGAPDDPGESVAERISRLCGGYHDATLKEGKVCLACVLGGEALDLPKALADRISVYFSWLIDWTEKAMTPGGSDRPVADLKAGQVIASLQGAMILAIATKRPELFLETESWLMRTVGGSGPAAPRMRSL